MPKPEHIPTSPVHDDFYASVITRFSWWRSKSGDRRFVIVYIRYDDQEEPGIFTPSTVGILEQFNTEPAERPWSDIVNFYKNGELVKLY